ncbi:hypothetical protein A2686_05240 [Candidatus Woesebacteria bacterium RIFCSPHIGHO2_01_FULL_38_10]|uniref:NlpC/P60 domain-containing protein n=1 Tax=Candidatus Woesebacteria bacterium RIFCSPLOWO2_01_FULL_39_10b TaxID=1802517 RepID=A0A1F8B929_9BACT|nr:MAG: hypothetical protein A2686_05240 [Candidatus Woesebacteria bacterium RIFCSPHIGHO2_01_FULL_38_10]OGM60531.1 MAG: hypothetical protein A2892_00730 [Candidatus Woesebacteria bacterium RIFCSPLOWO2_01_FULL_39_10b]
MKVAGLGIDCSGFVYQTLKYAFDRVGYPEMLEDSVEWPDTLGQRNEYRASIKSFTGGASRIIQPFETQSMDIIVIKSPTGEKYSHMALVLKENEGLRVTQSVIGQVPTGVHVSSLRIENSLPQFGFRPNLTEPWEELYGAGRLEFRRLEVF